MTDPITIQTTIKAPITKVWEYYNEPEHIIKWAFASDEWEAPYSENDLKVGGRFKTTMAARDKSSSFDFTGKYTVVNDLRLVEYDIDDGRHVTVEFIEVQGGVKVLETFDPENIHPREKQKEGWQAILDNFKKHVESS
jgi:uncharacterized protein YndB with AHSA1/START domain